ncbi:MAG: hypothetical protein ACRDU8_00240 [Egibacteraceae bacterium]
MIAPIPPGSGGERKGKAVPLDARTLVAPRLRAVVTGSVVVLGGGVIALRSLAGM